MWLTALRKEILEHLSGPQVLEALARATQRLRDGPVTQKAKETLGLEERGPEQLGAENEPTHGHRQTG